VGDATVEAIVEERNKRGPYRSLEDFIKRTKANKKTLEGLAKAGAFRSITNMSKKNLIDYINFGKQVSKGVSKGLFDVGVGNGENEDFKFNLMAEREALGFYISENPFYRFKALRDAQNLKKIGDIEEDEEVEIMGALTHFSKKKFKNGTKFTLRLEDDSGYIDAIIFINEDPISFEKKLSENLVLYVKGKVQAVEGEGEDDEEETYLEVKVDYPENIKTVEELLSLRLSEKLNLERIWNKFLAEKNYTFNDARERDIKEEFVRFWIKEIAGEEFAVKVPYEWGLKVLKALSLEGARILEKNGDNLSLLGARAIILKDLKLWDEFLRRVV
jgi:DNA polymerase III alpha subunit